MFNTFSSTVRRRARPELPGLLVQYLGIHEREMGVMPANDAKSRPTKLAP